MWTVTGEKLAFAAEITGMRLTVSADCTQGAPTSCRFKFDRTVCSVLTAWIADFLDCTSDFTGYRVSPNSMKACDITLAACHGDSRLCAHCTYEYERHQVLIQALLKDLSRTI